MIMIESGRSKIPAWWPDLYSRFPFERYKSTVILFPTTIVRNPWDGQPEGKVYKVEVSACQAASRILLSYVILRQDISGFNTEGSYPAEMKNPDINSRDIRSVFPVALND
jgi:hypothetical protein